jgi:hypothetical protein
VDDFSRNFSSRENTMLAAMWLAPLFAHGITQISLILFGAPVMLVVFAPILQRSGFDRKITGELGWSVAFPVASTTLDAVSDRCGV